MLGDYVLHYPLTDFAVGLLVIAAVLDLGRIVLKRPQWQIAIDLLLLLGFAGAAVSVGSGLWLVAAQDHGHSRALSIHHWFAYGTLGVSAAGVAAHLLARRRPKLAAIKTVSLVVSAVLVSAAGFFGGKMAHPASEAQPHSHDDGVTSTPATPSGDNKPDTAVPHPHDGSSSHAPTGRGKPPETTPDETRPHGHEGTTRDSHATPAGSGDKLPQTKPEQSTPHTHGADSPGIPKVAPNPSKPIEPGTKPKPKPEPPPGHSPDHRH